MSDKRSKLESEDTLALSVSPTVNTGKRARIPRPTSDPDGIGFAVPTPAPSLGKARNIAPDDTIPSFETEQPALAETVSSVPDLRSSSPELAAGETLGRYRLIERLGAGAMGVVWLARDPSLDRKIAIKVIHSKYFENDDAARRFLREARAMAKVSSRSVVAIFDAGQANDRLFIAMELIKGTTLGNLIRQRQPSELRDWRKWLRYMLLAGRGLAAAHAQAVLHRDFKPDNVMVDNTGRVCVTDFGLAELGGGSAPTRPSSKELGDGRRAPSQADIAEVADLTATGAMLGTPLYMSPEQLKASVIDTRADQFSFCVAAYEVIYGERPFDLMVSRDLPLLAQLVDVIEGQHFRPPVKSPAPARVRTALLRGLAANPTDRWPSMDALLEELSAALPSRRRKAAIIVGAALVPAVAAGITALAVRKAPLDVPSVRLPMPSISSANTTTRYVAEAPLYSTTTIDPSGTQAAIASRGRVSVINLTTAEVNTRALPEWGALRSTQFIDAKTIGFSTTASSILYKWDVDSGLVASNPPIAGASAWFGETTKGALVELSASPDANNAIPAGSRRLAVAGTTMTWDVAALQHIAIAPNRAAFAYSDGDSITVINVESGARVTIPAADATTLTWSSDNQLVYAVGFGRNPTLLKVSYGSKGIGTPVELYQQATGVIGHALIGAQRAFMIYDRAEFGSARWQVAAPGKRQESPIGAALGWLDAHTQIHWDPKTHEIYTATDGKRGRVITKVDGDPANATRDGDTLIVASRSQGARKVAAFSITTGALLWSWDLGAAHAVRCAGDMRAPCYALTAHGVHLVNSSSGHRDEAAFAASQAEDLAVSLDGERLAVVGLTAQVQEFRPSGEPIRTLATDVRLARSIAYGTDNALFVAGAVDHAHGFISIKPEGSPTAATLLTPGTVITMFRVHGEVASLTARRYDPHIYEIVHSK